MFSSMNPPHKKPTHSRQNDSGELDVFEASRYFSGTVDSVGFARGATLIREDRALLASDAGAKRLEISKRGFVKPALKGKGSCNQPSSPAGRLTSFLNSFFHQTASKQGRPKPFAMTTRAQSVKGDNEDWSSTLGRRKKRSSMSLSGTTTRSCDSKFIYSSATASGWFRSTPSLYDKTPINKAIQNKCSAIWHQKSSASCKIREVWEDKKAIDHVAWRAQRDRSLDDGLFEKGRVLLGNKSIDKVARLRASGFLAGDHVVSCTDHDGHVENKWVLNKATTAMKWVDELSAFKGRKSFRRRSEEEAVEEDGGSEASSDLFELSFDLHGDGAASTGRTRNPEIISKPIGTPKWALTRPEAY